MIAHGLHDRQRTFVVKTGTSSLIDESTLTPLLSNLASLAESLCALRRAGHKVVLVSSGAVGMGLSTLGLSKKLSRRAGIKSLAALGQCKLMSLWTQVFQELRQPIAQVLVSKEDIYEESRNVETAEMIQELLGIGVIPIINENDALCVSSLGGNDVLAVAMAGMVRADAVVFLTDVACLYDRNPRYHKDARRITLVEASKTLSVDVSSSGSDGLGTGGMGSKVLAAQMAATLGITGIITQTSQAESLQEILLGDEWFYEELNCLTKRRVSAGRRGELLYTKFLPGPVPTCGISHSVLVDGLERL